MKKLLIASLCITAFALTACDKKTNDATSTTSQTTNTAQASSLSHDNAGDIKSDLQQLQTLSNTKSQEALAFQDEATEAAQKGEKPALEALVKKMESYVTNFNKDLEGLNLKSSEASAVRDKMKKSNDLGLALAKAGIETPPNMTKITGLQKEATDLQQALLADMQSLEIKVNGK